MIGVLIRQDRIWRRYVKWLLVTLGSVLAICGIRSWLYLQAVRAGAGANAPGPMLLVLAVWVPLGLFLAYAGTLPRAGQLALSLPLTGRRLWFSHLAAVLLAGTVMLLLAGLMTALNDLALGRWLDHGQAVSPHGSLALLLQLFGGAALAGVVLQSWRPSLHRPTLGYDYVLLAAVTLLGILALLLLTAGRPAAWSLLTLGIAGAVTAAVGRSLPASLRLAANGAPASPGAAALAHAAQPARTVRRPIWWLLARTFYGDVKLLLLLPFFGLYGLLVSGLVAALAGDSDAGLLNLPLSWYLLLSLVPGFVRRLPEVDPLPVERRSLFALMVLPAMGLLAAGYLAGSLAAVRIHPDRERILLEERDAHLALLVPLDSFEIAWDGRPPALRAPWGESHPALTVPLSPLLRPVLYKPFATPWWPSTVSISEPQRSRLGTWRRIPPAAWRRQGGACRCRPSIPDGARWARARSYRSCWS
jgi:hypothetical protein